MIDRDGYRPNVAIVLCNAKNEVFWGKRIKEHAWQFPQGGIKMGESPEDAMGEISPKSDPHAKQIRTMLR